MSFPYAKKLVCLVCIISISGCASVYDLGSKIPGLDRILYKSSKAEVGPVKTQAGEVIEGTEVESTLVVEAPAPSPGPKSAPAPAVPPSNKAELTLVVQPPAPVQAKKHKLKGKVSVLANDGPISAEGVFVRLERADGQSLQRSTVPAQHNMDMADKIYAPGHMVVRKGDTLNFVNSDPIKHNVFSSSGANAFDLGTFGGGLQREVKLNEEGIVKVYCNIHPSMAAFVAVDDMGITQELSADDGSFEFTDLAAGEYQLSLWSIRGEQTQTLLLENGETLELDLTFDTANYKASTHSNKFGQEYKKPKGKREYF